MSMDTGAAAPSPRGQPGAVPPSGLVKAVVRPLTKILNPLIKKLAGRRHVRMAAQIWHVGRRSGRLYMTPAGARLAGDDVIVIPLTFGNRSDWARNVQVEGGCRIRLLGRAYTATQPEFLTVAEAQPLVRAAFSPMERASFRLLGIRQLMVLQAAPTGPVPA
jgi:deazaflavin-dependent oxidoreductase (nitroreductase family)